MTRGLSSHLIRNHRLTTAWLDKVWEAGIDVVELFCARQSLDYRNASQMAELGHWFRDSELKLHSLHSPMYSDDCGGRSGPSAVINIADPEKIRRRGSVDEIKRAIEIAETVPFHYLIQHVGVSGEEFEEQKVEAAFNSLEEINVFAVHRGVEVLLENIPNQLSSSERLAWLLEFTHLDNGFCFDTGHAHIMEGVEAAFNRMKDRIRSTHVHDNDGENDTHLFPMAASGGTIEWRRTMELLGSRGHLVPLMLELREPHGIDHPLAAVREVFQHLENLPAKQ